MMAVSMTTDDFAKFFRALYNLDPFPWQRRLAHHVACGDGWPAVLALPTAAGKTATIDMAVFHSALQAGLKSSERTAPLRIFFVVDRRIVVDEAYERAKHIASTLRQAQSGIMKEVAECLLRYGGEVPLHVSIMRGGMYRDDTWTRSPSQPTVCVSTVDQIGSRLLFRGYGISESKRPIHAGLIGCDSLIILDEAHISQPFLETLEGVQRYRGERWAEKPLARHVQFVQMSATPKPGTPFFGIDEQDRAHTILRARLEASKLARLVPAVSTEEDTERENQETFAQAVVTETLKMTSAHLEQMGPPDRKRRSKKSITSQIPAVEPARVIGVVVNRVATARRVFELLSKHSTDEHQSCYAILLTGRIRPYDRDELLYRAEVSGSRGGWLPYIAAGRGSAESLEKPLFVVATQTVEVGANVDFDALVTEAAPLDSLRQRFGRLDRLGRRKISKAAILTREDAVSKNADDAIYGNAISRTWSWLRRIARRSGEIDFGLSALEPHLEALDTQGLEEMCSSSISRHAPVLLPAHLDLWCQTNPTPSPDPDVTVFLHGAETGPADVQVVWRADLPPDLIREEEQNYIDTVALVPPTSLEALSLPIWAVRRWLRNDRSSVAFADIEGLADRTFGSSSPAPSRLALRWRGLENSELIAADALRPGDTVVVPSTDGGADAFGWKPDSSEPVSDVADACARLARWRSVLRLDTEVVRSWQPSTTDDNGRTLAQAIGATLVAAEEEELEPSFDDTLRIIRNWPGVPDWARNAAAELTGRRNRRRPVRSAHSVGWLLLARHRRQSDHLAAEVSADFTDEDDTSCMVGGNPIALPDHCNGVSEWANRFARAIGFSDSMAADLTLAGWLHDIGKADPRFQVMLHGGDEVAAATARFLLGKSGMDASDRRAFRLAKKKSGLPTGWRHEYLSVKLLEKNSGSVRDAHDEDLVIFLIGTHHGFGRSLAPVITDREPSDISFLHDSVFLNLTKEERVENPICRLDSGWTDRFWRLVRRYGYWGLAFLEAILRLADHRRSEEEQEVTS